MCIFSGLLREAAYREVVIVDKRPFSVDNTHCALRLRSPHSFGLENSLYKIHDCGRVDCFEAVK